MGLVTERVSLQRWTPPWIRYQHVARYQWLADLVKGCRVIEAACGTGYGSKIMINAGAKSVTGFDISEDAVREARSNNANEGVSFCVADVMHLPVESHSFDLFVSLETIEHIDDDDAFVREVLRVLRPGGKLICSTPNRAMTNPGRSILDAPFNPYHKREYTLQELGKLLNKHFGSVNFYAQTSFSLSYGKFLASTGSVLPSLAARLHQARKLIGIPWENFERHYPQSMPVKGEPEVLIAVCET